MKNKTEFQKSLGINVRRVRVDKSFTIEELALEAGLTYSQVSRIELGKRNPTAYTIYVLSETLKVSPSHFFHTSFDNMESRDHSNGALSEKPNE